MTPITGAASPPPESCVGVFLEPTADRTSIDAVGDRLGESAGLVELRFVSKEDPLADPAERFPELFEDLQANPLPDA